MRDALSRLRTDEGYERALATAFRSSDVFVHTYPKSGTTWMQQILHSLRGGDQAFEEISCVVPWLETAWDMGIDPDGPQVGAFRAFKTHFMAAEAPTVGRHIYIVRDPKDVLVSFYHFFEGWMFEPGSITLPEFATEFFLDGSRSGRWWDHVLSWWPRLTDANVLPLCYEAMLSAPDAAIAQVARFLGVSDATAIGASQRHAAFASMSAERHKYDEHILRALRDPVCGLPPGETTKVRRGKAGDHKDALPASIVKALDARFRDTITARLGIEDYPALRDALSALTP